MLSIFRLRIGCIHWRNKEGKLSYGETIKNHNSRKTGIKIPPSMTDSESVTLWKSSMSSLALLQHSCFLQENVVCKQKNVVINRVSSPNVESLPHIKAFFFSLERPPTCLCSHHTATIWCLTNWERFQKLGMLILPHLKLILITKPCTACMIVRVIGCSYLYLEIEKCKCFSSFFTWVLRCHSFLCLVLENLLELPPTLLIWFSTLTSLQISSSFAKFQLSVGKI